MKIQTTTNTYTPTITPVTKTLVPPLGIPAADRLPESSREQRRQEGMEINLERSGDGKRQDVLLNIQAQLRQQYQTGEMKILEIIKPDKNEQLMNIITTYLENKIQSNKCNKPQPKISSHECGH